MHPPAKTPIGANRFPYMPTRARSAAQSKTVASPTRGEAWRNDHKLRGHQFAHFFEDGLAHLGSAGFSHVWLHDIGGSEAACERVGDLLVDQIGFLD